MAIAPIAANDIVQVVIESQVQNQTILNVLHYKAETNFSPKTYFEALDELCQKLSDNVVPSLVKAMLNAMAGNCEVRNIRAQRVAPVRSVYVNTSIGQPGVLTPTNTLSNVGGTITKQTDLAGRGRTGSFHMAGLPAADFAAGSLTVAAVGRLIDIGEFIQSNILNVGGAIIWRPGTYSPNAAAGSQFHELVNVFPQTTARVMRRRTLGVGI